MNRYFTNLKHYSFITHDGEKGKVEDLFYDDRTFAIRYLVLGTGGPLDGTGGFLVLPASIRDIDDEKKTITLDKTMDQIRSGPNINTKKPISRLMEEKLHNYYQVMPYWKTYGFYETHHFPIIAATTLPQTESGREMNRIIDQRVEESHIRSAGEMTEYQAETSDKKEFKIDDLVINSKVWELHYLILSVNNWLKGHKVLVSTRLMRNISWDLERITISLHSRALEISPLINVS